jgi:hypothetical protein
LGVNNEEALCNVDDDCEDSGISAAEGVSEGVGNWVSESSTSEMGVAVEGIWATVCLLVLNMVLIDARPRLGLVVGTAEGVITSAEDILYIDFGLWGKEKKGWREE